MKHCAVCGRTLSKARVVVWSMWEEEVCRACYKWAMAAMYGVSEEFLVGHTMQMPWPHGMWFQIPEAH